MALNLSTLTSPATSGDVLAEVLTTADFLEPVPVLRNLARGSNKGGDAKQDVALKQPKALPLIDGDGYLYLSGVAGNYASVPAQSADALDVVIHRTGQWNLNKRLIGKDDNTNRDWYLNADLESKLFFAVFAVEGVKSYQSTVALPFSGKETGWVRVTTDPATGDINFYTSYNGEVWVQLGATLNSGAFTFTNSKTDIAIACQDRPTPQATDTGGYHRVIIKDGIDGNPVLDVDFTATNVRHNDTKFKCATGQVVTINQSGNDPATIIKKPVLRFDGVDDFMDGVFNQTITGGYMFAAFSVLGSGGDNLGRVFSVNSTGANDYNTSGAIFSLRNSNSLFSYFNTDYEGDHTALFDDANGDILHESLITNGTQLSRVNNADEASTSEATTISAEEFNVGASRGGVENTSIDLEYLALFPSLTDSQADAVRNYINNRNTVFLRHDTDGYYFYNPQDLSSGAVTTWNGRIVGSDNGDVDKNATQSTSADQPTSDGYKVTFADNTDHFDIPSTTQAGWQVVGTSLGTFAYKVNNTAVTELNLLGNLGGASYRKAGDLYGIILLPESATGRHINEAKKLLTDRGASVSATADVGEAWRNRADIVQFDGGDMSNATNVIHAWRNCTSLTSFSTELPLVANASYAWDSCTSLTSFSSDLPLVQNVYSAWQNCSSLTSFSTELPRANDAHAAWRNCTSLASFSTALPSVTNASYAWYGCSSLTSFSSDLSSTTTAANAWRNCSSLESFSADLPSATSVNSAWRNCSSLESFSTDLPLATNVSSAWRGCSSLTSFDTPLPSATNLTSAFQDCTQLAEIGQLQTSNVTTWYYSFYNCRSLLSFPVLDTSSGTDFFGTWRNCSGLTQFPLLDCNLGRRFAWTWQGCSSLEDFPAGFFDNWNPLSISNEVFQNTWDGCTALTAQSVENILTSIDASGKWATSDGTSGGTALADAGIDIDYDVSTGSLSAATNAAIRSLDTKGWEVYINGEIRTGVELLDLQGFYFFESEGLAAANVTSWDSSIGTSSASLDLVGTQTDANDQPVADGTVVTFADNTDHIDITSTTQAGWQVVGTSLGTFAYKVNADAVTELNILGNVGNPSFRRTGDLYGIILLPESATSSEVNEAKTLLTDRGASASVSVTADVRYAFSARHDIVQFDGGDMSDVTNVYASWDGCSSLTSFSTELPSATYVTRAWKNCSSFTSFNIELPSAINASEAWRGCSSLTSFSSALPSATDVGNAWRDCSSLTSFSTSLPSATNATYAWRDCSSLTSFSTDLPSATNVANAWNGCSSLTSFSSDLPLVENVYAAWYGCSSLTSFSTELPRANDAHAAWYGCSSLTSFSTEIPRMYRVSYAWQNCASLTDFSADIFSNWNSSTIPSGVFNNTWDGCTSLTAQSVENILTSIDASGKYATSTGLSGGSALADAGIDIDYNGDPLSAATTAAITSLKAKGWSIIVNNVTL